MEAAQTTEQSKIAETKENSFYTLQKNKVRAFERILDPLISHLLWSKLLAPDSSRTISPFRLILKQPHGGVKNNPKET
jgi:hypothetical protein